MADDDKHNNPDAESRTRSAYRAVSGDAYGDVSFSGGGQSALGYGQSRLTVKNKKITARLPMPLPSEKIERQAYLRGAADGAALYRKYHKEGPHTVIKTPEARALFDVLEQVRCETLGVRHMKGVGDNLIAALEKACEKKGYETASNVPLEDGLYVLAFEAMSRHDLGPIARRVANKWRLTVERKIGYGAFMRMFTRMEDQADFAEAADMFIASLYDIDLESDEYLPADEATETKTEEKNSAPIEDFTESDEEAAEESGEQDSETGTQAPSSISNPMQYFEQQDSDAQGEPVAGAEQMQGDASGEDGGEADTEQTRPEINPPKNLFEARDRNYSIYANEFDEVVDAHKLADTSELSALRAQLDSQLQPLQTLIGKLANRLQRRLMSRQQRRWDFDAENGALNTARLTRIIVDPNLPITYKREIETDFKDTVLTLLIDNSGSMRGRPITIAALTADVLMRTLERAGVKVEILGFTTVNWKGGKSRAKWTQEGRPVKPGRLNDIRHIIYKGADAPIRRARQNIGLMLKEGLLKENIDGEALLWAYQRLSRRREQRKILMVISDGAPVDDSTLSSNRSSYLEQDLHQIIAAIEEKGDVEITAIGIGHDVGKYYNRALTIRDAADLPGVMMNELAQLFDK